MVGVKLNEMHNSRHLLLL